MSTCSSKKRYLVYRVIAYSDTEVKRIRIRLHTDNLEESRRLIRRLIPEPMRIRLSYIDYQPDNEPLTH